MHREEIQKLKDEAFRQAMAELREEYKHDPISLEKLEKMENGDGNRQLTTISQ